MTLMDNRHTAATWTKQYISGKWVDGTGEKMLENINPYTDEVIAVWRSSSKEDIDRAYQSAKKVQWNGRQLCHPLRKECFAKCLP